MSPVQNLINEIDKALAITPDLFVDFIVNVNSLNANGENIHRQVRGCDVVDLFLDRGYPNSSIMLCLSNHDRVFDFHERYLVMHHALSTFLDNPTAATFNKLNAARIKTLKQHQEPPAQPKPLTDKLSTFSESLKDMIKHVEEKDCRELNDLTISGSFDVFLNDSELDDLCLRIFTKHYIDIVVNHDRKTLTVVFEDSIDNYDTMKRINRLELITDKIASTLTKSGNFNKATLKQAAKALTETKISAPRY